MSVRNRLDTIRYILVKLMERVDCVEITGYDKVAINCFVEGLDRAIAHYKREATRAARHYR